MAGGDKSRDDYFEDFDRTERIELPRSGNDDTATTEQVKVEPNPHFALTMPLDDRHSVTAPTAADPDAAQRPQNAGQQHQPPQLIAGFPGHHARLPQRLSRKQRCRFPDGILKFTGHLFVSSDNAPDWRL